MKSLFIFLSLVSFRVGAQENNFKLSQTFSEYATTKVSASDMTNSGRRMATFSTRQEPEGSPYLFNTWVKGTVYLKNNNVLSEPSAILNYNKINKGLELNLGDEKVLQIDMSEIKSFNLEENGKIYSFIQLPGQATYSLVLHIDSLYSLYKSINTKFYPSDYVNKGLYETGYKYDRYVDQNIYYIIGRDNKTYTIDQAYKKSLNKLEAEMTEAKIYFTKNRISENLESDLTSFIIFLNKK